MAELANGSQTAVIDTEHTLDTRSTFGIYQLKVNVGNMADGDVTIFRVKAKARNADASAEEEYKVIYANAQDLPVITCVPVTASNAVFTLEQTDGTGRAYTWSVNEI
jgi:hypothetical protein